MKRLVILAQFDPESGLPAHVAFHLEKLRSVATRIVLVSNSPLSETARANAEALADRVIVRANSGFDFAAWRDALSQERVADWDEVVLTNSSIVGPFLPLSKLFADMETKEIDFWGLVRSREHCEHLQSYFLVFRQPVLDSDTWLKFWAQVQDFETKKDVIEQYELTLTGLLEDAGFRSTAQITWLPSWASLRLRRAPRGSLLPIRFANCNYKAIHIVAPLALVQLGVPYVKAPLVLPGAEQRPELIRKLKARKGVDYPWEALGI